MLTTLHFPARPLCGIRILVGLLAAGFIVTGAALARQQDALRQARYDASHDETTGLPNRRALTAMLERALARGDSLGLVMLDLDGFKEVNDVYGHECGNALLARVGANLAALPLPAVAFAARLSGDEFALLVSGGLAEVGAAAHAAWRAVAASRVPLDEGEVAASASVGYAVSRAGISVPDLLRDADNAMYTAKTTGCGVHPYAWCSA